MKASKYIWKNGEFLNWNDAQTHVLTHALHYGTAVFEGIRAYSTSSGPAIFRAQEHYKRLLESAKMMEMPLSYTVDSFTDITCDLIKRNQLDSCYIRPLCYFGFKEMGLNPGNNPVDSIIAMWEWGTYLGEEGLSKGVKCKISSWKRIDSQISSPHTKASANYINSIFAKKEALRCGYDEAILLNLNGFIAEGPGENLFVVKDKTIYTPPYQDGVLKGITALSIMQIAKDLGYEVIQKSLIRDELILADELFFTGTAAEVTPIREIDGQAIGSGSRGPVTKVLQDLFFDIVSGKNTRYKHWLTFT